MQKNQPNWSNHSWDKSDFRLLCPFLTTPTQFFSINLQKIRLFHHFVLEIFAKSTLTHISGTRFFRNMEFKFRKKITTKFFNKFRKPYFWSIFLIFRRTSFFSKNLALLRTTSYEFLTPYQNLAKANNPIPRTNRRMI